MSQLDRREQQRKLRAQLDHEFPDFELLNWYIQYRDLKAAYPDAVLLYRLGDFYETFDDDAKLVAALLDVTLTYKKFANHKRTKAEQRAPMAGMPYHAVERYVTAIVGAGYRVAIAEQTSETPSSKSDTRPKSVFAGAIEQRAARRDIADREVVRVITPGTVIDSGMLPATQNNYLAAVIVDGGRAGLAYADLSTGEFCCTEFAGERAATHAQGELARLQAVELLVPDDAALRLPGLDPSSARLEHDLEFMTKDEREMLLPGERVARKVEGENSARWAHGHITGWPTWRWKLQNAADALMQQLRVRSLDGFGLRDKPLAARAAGAVIQYIHETQRSAASQISALRTYTTGGTMFLDPQTRRNLEILAGSGGKAKGSLVGVLDQTRTPMGGRLLRRWISQPLLEIELLRARQDGVAHFADDALKRATVREKLKQVGDLERAVNRVIQGVGVATPRDMVRLREALRALPALADALDGWMPPGQGTGDRGQGTGDRGQEGEDAWWVEDDGLAQAPSPKTQAPGGRPQAPSLREQRESRSRARARYDEDDLFGEGDWEDEPALGDKETRRQGDEEPFATSGAAGASSEHLGAISLSASLPVSMSGLDPCADVLAFLEQALDDDPPALLGASNYLRAAEENGEAPRRVIRPRFEPQMDEIVDRTRQAQRWIDALEPRERTRLGIKNDKGLRVDYNKVFGYYIEVSNSYADRVPADYIRKQTVATGERYYTAELKEFETVVEGAKEKLSELEQKAFIRICAAVAAEGPRLLATGRALAEIDVYAALAEAAVRGRYIRPELHDDTRLRVVGGRHPVVEQMLEGEFIPNDINLDTEEDEILLVTGPNMAGKSTILRQVALMVLMAQIGSFVPADQAEIGIVDRIFTRIGAQDDIATGQSTFMVEMIETAALLVQSTRRSLIILDEVGRGTSTYDGMAIARAVVEYIHNEPRLGCRTLFATHYHELTDLEQVLPRVKNYHMAAVEQDNDVVFLHELRRGGADRSYGIHVAQLAGIPRPVIKRASELLAELERGPEARSQRPGARGQGPGAKGELSPTPDPRPPTPGQLGLFDLAPSPVVELLRRLNVNELSPIEALTKLYELQRLANQ
ncbi:MAG: DNA mismatch repair protein MutS [Kouleothrix sp.]|nr:DNA mismatch repair protein MutS [Kouleothrix sp.]